jgi:4-amino-4-deoxy-L-arabinose transferase-like glycosyltransferase
MATLHGVRVRLVGFSAKSTVLGSELLLIILFFVQGISFIRANSPTYDEAVHLAAGYSYLATRDFRLDSEHPPLIKSLQALPLFLIYRWDFNIETQQGDYLVGQNFLYRSAVSAHRVLGLSRLVNLFLGALLLALIGWWAHRLWGSRSAILATAVACVEPNLIAHSSLVTTDIGVTLFMFLTVYLLWEYLIKPRWWLLAATGFSAGLALVSKFSALLLVPMVGVVVLSLLIAHQPFLLPLKTVQNGLRQNLLHAAGVLSLILFFALLTIPPAYLFQGFEPWVSGFSRFKHLADVGRPAFFLGEYSYHGWWSYYLICFLIKTPVGSLMLIAASLLCYRVGSPLQCRAVIFFLLPVAVIFLAMTQSKVNIGLRHILIVYPFLFVLGSRLATVQLQRRRLVPALIGIALTMTTIFSLRVAPHQLAYFNEFFGGPDQGYRYLSDSNLDWGQDLRGVKVYMDKENLPIIYLAYFGTAPPSYYGIRYQYVPGAWPLEWPPPADKVPTDASRKILAISVTNLQDVGSPYDPLFRWLWMRKPVAKIGYSIFVYDLTNDREGLAKLEETYDKAGVKLPS